MGQSPNPGAIILTLAAASVFAGPLFPFVALTLPIWAQALSGGRRRPSSRVRSGPPRQQQQQQRGFGFSLPDDEPQYEHRWALLLWAACCISSLCVTCCLSRSLSCCEAGGAACCYNFNSPWSLLWAGRSLGICCIHPGQGKCLTPCYITCRSAFTPAQKQQMRMLSQRRRQMAMLQQQRMMQQIMWQMSRRGGGLMGPFGMQGPFMF